MTLSFNKRSILIILNTSMLLGINGCAINSIFVSYPSQIAPIKQALNSPSANISARNSSLIENISGNDGLLYSQEAGRVAQITGDFDASQRYYNQAITAYTNLDFQATVSATKLGATSGSLLLNDNAIPYSGYGYERIMLHQYQAFNYLFKGDFQGALVEVRRSNELQGSEQEKYAASLASIEAIENGAVDAEISRLGQFSGTVTSSFLNAYSYYTTGILHEVLGEPNDAYIDYRKAAQINPDNHYLQQDLVRLAKQLAMPQYKEFKQRWGEAKVAKSNDGQVIFIVEQGFVPKKSAVTIPFTRHGNLQTIALPTYQLDNVPAIRTAKIEGLGTILNAEPIANIGALAVTALKEALPGILARVAARAYAKSELTQQLAQNTNQIGGALSQIYNIVTEQADRRSWLTLPNQAQIGRSYVPAGEYPVKINQANEHKVKVIAGKTTLVWAINTGKLTRIYSTII